MDPNNISAAILAGQATGSIKHLQGFAPMMVVPEFHKAVAIERLPELKQPERVKAHPKFDDAASLILYFNRYKNPASILIADLETSTVVGIIDQHEPVTSYDANGARYGEHRATFVAKHSQEWLTWVGKNEEEMGQDEFATFIEDNAPDVQVPLAAELYEMALKIDASKGATFKSQLRQQDGSVSLTYSEETTANVAGGTVKIPKEIQLLIPVYVGSEPEEVTARFRYRLNGGRLTLWYSLLRIENLKRSTFNGIIEKIAHETELPVLAGRPA